ncbi:hypothetical protein HDU86_000874 [Geranomyces michiganensis]|nr:hypothetical protein HDU86_000874 [Geranomyces michiganensis]
MTDTASTDYVAALPPAYSSTVEGRDGFIQNDAKLVSTSNERAASEPRPEGAASLHGAADVPGEPSDKPDSRPETETYDAMMDNIKLQTSVEIPGHSNKVPVRGGAVNNDAIDHHLVVPMYRRRKALLACLLIALLVIAGIGTVVGIMSKKSDHGSGDSISGAAAPTSSPASAAPSSAARQWITLQGWDEPLTPLITMAVTKTPGMKAEDCAKICNQTPACESAFYHDSECYPKEKLIAPPKFNPRVTLIIPVIPALDQWKNQSNVEIQDRSLFNATIDAGRCAALCAAVGPCQAISLTDAGVCYFSRSTGPVIAVVGSSVRIKP